MGTYSRPSLLGAEGRGRDRMAVKEDLPTEAAATEAEKEQEESIP